MFAGFYIQDNGNRLSSAAQPLTCPVWSKGVTHSSHECPSLESPHTDAVGFDIFMYTVANELMRLLKAGCLTKLMTLPACRLVVMCSTAYHPNKN